MSIIRMSFFLILALFLGCDKQSKNTFNVTVSAYGGEVEILRGDEVLAIRLAMQLELNDIVKVPSDGYVQLLFREGAVVTGMADSALQLPKEGIVRLIQGESFYHIEKQQARSFVVQTDQANIAVYGTQFMVEVNNDETHVALLNGSISIESQEKNLNLEMGQEIHISETQEIISEMSPETLERFHAIYHIVFQKVDKVESEYEEILDESPQDEFNIIEELRERNFSLQRELTLLQGNISGLEQEVSRLEELSKSYENLYRVEREWVERYKRLLQQNGIAFQEEES